MKRDWTRARVLLSGDSLVNPAQKTCLVKHKLADFKRLAVAARLSVYFDDELGEKKHRQGFVCDEHKVSDRVEKPAQPTAASIV